MQIFSGRIHPHFSLQLASALNLPLSDISIETLPDGEISLEILEDVRGDHLYLVQPIAGRPHDALFELLMMADAAKRAQARKMTAVIPYFGYARQERRAFRRLPITAKLVADQLQAAGIDHLMTCDLHASQIEGFFSVPVENFSSSTLLAAQVEKSESLLVVAPDLGAIDRARSFSELLGCDYVVLEKRRVDSKSVEIRSLIGRSVEGCDLLLVDDLCSTGETLVQAASFLKEKGANRIDAAITHPLMVGHAKEKLQKSPLRRIICSDSIPLTWESKKLQKISLAGLFAQKIDGVERV